jgi:leader peptidase (prepilin peptidase)/N-methyltransferase
MLTVILSGALTGLAALALTRRMRVIAATRSRWLTTHVHVVLACLAGAGAGALAQTWAEALAFAALALACSLLVVIDLAALRLPDAIVLPMYPILGILLTVAAAVADDWTRLGRAAAAGVILLIVYFVLAFAYPAGLGLGDVKLAGLLGLFLGWFGWQYVLLGTLTAFILSAIVAAVLLAIRRANRGTEFPFGPCMIISAAISATGWPSLLG